MSKTDFFINEFGRRIYINPKDKRGNHLAASRGNLNPSSLKLWNIALSLFHWEWVVDVGCNYGEMLVSAQVPGDVKCVAFEPNPRVLPFLRETLVECGLTVDLREKAVANVVNEALPFVLDEDWSGTSSLPRETDSSVFGHNHQHTTIQVPITTLDAEFLHEAPSSACIKIDVEGHEESVLEGAHKLLGQMRHWAVMLEVVHMEPAQFFEIACFSPMYLLDKKTNALVRMTSTNYQDFVSQLSTGQFYTQDALLLSAPLEIPAREDYEARFSQLRDKLQLK